ncbi:hypothetical protein B0H17DRAFT_1205095 [Mycena rosella]|uniref:Uncharacterized protein n=1 Tax=Mycena rosella TaxID=1033263 RepID=A0AAD7D8D4_MYCRO|nr:hypothetical protein B0H17DRAFT_1205095 [Mycena rosella]
MLRTPTPHTLDACGAPTGMRTVFRRLCPTRLPVLRAPLGCRYGYEYGASKGARAILRPHPCLPRHPAPHPSLARLRRTATHLICLHGPRRSRLRLRRAAAGSRAAPRPQLGGSDTLRLGAGTAMPCSVAAHAAPRCTITYPLRSGRPAVRVPRTRRLRRSVLQRPAPPSPHAAWTADTHAGAGMERARGGARARRYTGRGFGARARTRARERARTRHWLGSGRLGLGAHTRMQTRGRARERWGGANWVRGRWMDFGGGVEVQQTAPIQAPTRTSAPLRLRLCPASRVVASVRLCRFPQPRERKRLQMYLY